MTWLLLVQWLHIVAGLAWFGGYLVLALGVWPALLRRPAAEARATWQALEGGLGTLMMLAGNACA